MAEINPDVLAQLHRIHSAVNDGTVDKPSIVDALAKLWELLSGPRDPIEEAPSTHEEEEPEEADEPEDEPDEHPHRAKSRRKR